MFSSDFQVVLNRFQSILERLERVVINLLSNATKFTEKGGSIQVRIMDLNHSVRFEVQDTGKGFSPEDAKKIFQRFYQMICLKHIHQP